MTTKNEIKQQILMLVEKYGADGSVVKIPFGYVKGECYLITHPHDKQCTSC